jgi:hypothetical protein
VPSHDNPSSDDNVPAEDNDASPDDNHINDDLDNDDDVPDVRVPDVAGDDDDGVAALSSDCSRSPGACSYEQAPGSRVCRKLAWLPGLRIGHPRGLESCQMT